MSKVHDVKKDAWWKGVSRFQWIVLLVASLGWIFDTFEGQIFVTAMREMMSSLMPLASDEERGAVGKLGLGAFLIGGTVGGIYFGALSDRIGRVRTLVITILVYSLFTCLTAFAQSAWQVVVLRFFVAIGVGGEWAVAGALVAEVFPGFARVRALGIFHATSALGSFMAIAAGAFIVGNPALKTEAIPDLNWRLAFGIGVLPVLLTIWIRLRMKEPESWRKAQEKRQNDPTQKAGRVGDLFRGELRRRTLVGVGLAAIGLATFWGVKVFGKDLLYDAELRHVVAVAALETEPDDGFKLAHGEVLKKAEMIGHFLVMIGGLFGMLSFGPISERLKRRGAFAFFFVGAFFSTVILFGFCNEMSRPFYWVTLPIFGFLVSGIHSGYAIYFPELFPSRLRGAGGGTCFNLARIFAAPVLFITAWMEGAGGFTYADTAVFLSVFFLLGLWLLRYAPETHGQELPE